MAESEDMMKIMIGEMEIAYDRFQLSPNDIKSILHIHMRFSIYR